VREIRDRRSRWNLPRLAASGLGYRRILHPRFLELESGYGLRTSLSLRQVFEGLANPFVVALSMILAAEIFVEESPQRP
jgi:hypothetical protein